jgi:signal transduction histidine kinase
MAHLSIRAALACGLAVTLVLWLYTAYTFNRQLDELERDAAVVASRYLKAQELLTTVRTQILVASVRVRDALRNPDPRAVADYRDQVARSQAAIDHALTAYVPVLESDEGRGEIARLRREVDDFRATIAEMLSDAPGRSADETSDLLDVQIVPRREAAVRISEEVQTLNRVAFLQQQADLAALHRAAETRSTRQLGLALALSATILLLVGAYAGRLEHKLRAQLQRDATLSRELRDTHARLLQAQEQERKTIARELHDEVGQVLTAVKFELGLAQRALEARGLESAPLNEAQSITAGAIRSVRDLTHLLHPSALDDLGLGPAVDVLLRGLARRHNLEVVLTQHGMNRRFGAATEVAAYRIVQEALTNVARHARAGRCAVELNCDEDMLLIDVDDDGIGFDVGPEAPDTPHVGLRGIHERAAALGGVLQVISNPGRGSRIHVALPLAAAAPQAAHG